MKRATNAMYRAAADRQYGSEGSIEVDDNAAVSRGADPGAYVQAWVWVYTADITPADIEAAPRFTRPKVKS